MTATHLTPDEFRRLGHEAVEWVARYWETVGDHPVQAQVAPGDVRAQLPADAPADHEDFASVLADLDRIVLPGLTHWQHPSFFAFFPANTSGPGVLGDLIASGLGVNGMNWATSPAVTEVEQHVCDWMADLLGLGERFQHRGGSGGGVIQDTASSALLVALLAARHRKTDGGDLSLLRAYTSEHAHSSVVKGARVAGLRDDQVRLLVGDDSLAIRPDEFAAQVADDLAAGLVPFFVCATVGSTSTMAVDPVAAIASVAEEHGLWLHVDAAMAGVAAICPEHRWVVDGVDRADSFCTNPHKWLFTTFDCDLLFVADGAALERALGIAPPYLRNEASDAGAVVDFRDWQVPLGRRFRALKLWFVLRHYGVSGLQAELREDIELTNGLAMDLANDPRFELFQPPRLNLVCFRHRDGDAATDALVDAVNASGEALLTRTVVEGRPVIRVCIGATATEPRHVDALFRLLQRLA